MRTIDQNKTLHKLLGKLKVRPEVKGELVYQFTKARTSHSSEMTVAECDALIKYLRGVVATIQANDPCDKMRKKILSICHEMNWTVRGALDWKRINAWLLKYGHLHKPLNDYTEQELPTLVTQFEHLLKSYYAAFDKNKNLP